MRNKIYMLLSLVPALGFLPCLAQNFTDQTASLAPGFPNGRAAWGDYDNDGDVDVVVNGELWENSTGTGFAQVLGSLGSCVWADGDNDGLLDLFDYENRILYHNEGTTTPSFAFVSAQPLPIAVGQAASWADFNNDGEVDLYVGGHGIWDTVSAYYAGTSNPVPATYTNPNPGTVRSVISCDFDRDGDQDILLADHLMQASVLYLNDGSGHFTDVASARGVAGNADEPAGWADGHTIGSAWGDLDNDGYFDLFVGSFSHSSPYSGRSRFLKNLGPAGGYVFEDKSASAGLAWQESYATPALGDYDNDGDLDLFLTTAYAGDHPVLYRNDGNWTFTDVTAAEGLAGLGSTHQAAWADIDNDGDLDLSTDGKIFVNNESDTGANHWLKVKLAGDGSTVNAAAIGAEVRIDLGGGTILTRQIEGGTGEGNQNDLVLHFGLGSETGPVDLDITFGGQSFRVAGVGVDQIAACSLPDGAASDGTTLFHLETGVSGNGTVSPSNGWYAAGTNLALVPVPGTNHRFAGWTGDVPAGHETDNPFAVTMDQSRQITALFDPLTAQGTPIWWLNSHGLTVEDDLLDSDNDGVETWKEWVCDTIPTNENSVLKITDVVADATGADVFWQGGVQSTQWLEHCTNLVSDSWVPVFTNEPPTSATNSFRDASAINREAFYRLKVCR